VRHLHEILQGKNPAPKLAWEEKNQGGGKTKKTKKKTNRRWPGTDQHLKGKKQQPMILTIEGGKRWRGGNRVVRCFSAPRNPSPPAISRKGRGGEGSTPLCVGKEEGNAKKKKDAFCERTLSKHYGPSAGIEKRPSSKERKKKTRTSSVGRQKKERSCSLVTWQSGRA